MSMRLKSIFVVAACLSIAQISLHAENEAAKVNESLETIRNIYGLACKKKPLPENELKKVLSESLKEIKAPEQLARVAVMCHNLTYWGKAEDQDFDNCFESAFWLCVEKISRIKGPSGADALRDIANMTHPDGGNRLTLDAFIEAQKK